MVWSDQSQFPFYVIDNNGNIILTIDSTGLHLDGTVGHIDMQVSSGQPTIFFSNPNRTSRAYINAPGGDSVAQGSPDYVSALPGGPSVHNLSWIRAGFSDFGLVLAGGVTFLGGHLRLTDLQTTLEYIDETLTSLVKLRGDKFGMQTVDQNGNGFGLSLTSGYLHRVLAGTYQGWQSLSTLYQNGWGNLGGNWETGQYKLTADGIVEFEGTIIGGTKTDGTVLWTMPAAYRPSKDKIMNCTIVSSGSAANVSLRLFAATGQVQCFGISGTVNGNMSLESTRYSLF